jgi:vitamin B12 transporter
MPSIRITAGRAAIVAAGALALGLKPAPAQDYQQLEGIVIEGAGLAPIEARNVGSAYSIVTGEELERRQIRHAADALRSMPGVSIGQSGGPGSFTQLRIRGAEANHSVVLIDGVEVNSLSAGEFDFASLLAADIERIEVIRGPQSGVYGANALAGVVNIITKKGEGPARVTASAEAGGLASRAATATASAGSSLGHLRVTAAGSETDGFNVARSGGEADGSEQTNFSARGGLTPSESFRVEVSLRYQKNRADIDQDLDFDGLLDDSDGDVDRREQRIARISAELDTLDKRWTHKLFADYLEDDFSSSSDIQSSDSTNLGERRHFGYQTSFVFSTPDILEAQHRLTGLVEHKDESFSSAFISPFFSATGDAERKQTGFVAEYQGRFLENLALTGNIRRDLNDSFDDATTYRVATAYTIPAWDAKLHASYGKGITNPTFFEQFGFTLDFQGNPDLRPEEATGWDIGVEKRWLNGRLIADVTYFNMVLLDEIVGSGQTVINLDGESDRQGVEVSLTAIPVAGLALTGSYTYTDSEDPDGFQEIRRPKHAAALNIGYEFAGGKARIDAGLFYNGDRKDTIFGGFGPFPTTVLDEYLLVNLAASYKLDERITLFGRVQNLLDADYEEVFGFSGAPAVAYAGLKLSFADELPLEPAK